MERSGGDNFWCGAAGAAVVVGITGGVGSVVDALGGIQNL